MEKTNKLWKMLSPREGLQPNVAVSITAWRLLHPEEHRGSQRHDNEQSLNDLSISSIQISWEPLMSVSLRPMQ